MSIGQTSVLIAAEPSPSFSGAAPPSTGRSVKECDITDFAESMSRPEITRPSPHRLADQEPGRAVIGSTLPS